MHPLIVKLAEALDAYTSAALDDCNPVTIVSKAEAACEAFRHFDDFLISQSDWSNPLRHYHALDDAFWSNRSAAIHSPLLNGPHQRVNVRVLYSIAVREVEEFISDVEARFALDEPISLEDAAKLLLIADGWDPSRYSQTRFLGARLLEVETGDQGPL